MAARRCLRSNLLSIDNLYHHLDVLQQAGLLDFRYGESRAKEFYLKKPRRPDTAFLQLDRADTKGAEKLDRLVALLHELFGDEIPNLDKIVHTRILLMYPWSVEERDETSAVKAWTGLLSRHSGDRPKRDRSQTEPSLWDHESSQAYLRTSRLASAWDSETSLQK